MRWIPNGTTTESAPSRRLTEDEASPLSSMREIARTVLRRARRAVDAFLGADSPVDSAPLDRDVSLGAMGFIPAEVPPETIRMATGAPTPMSFLVPPGTPERVILPMSSGFNVKPGETALITARPQTTPLRVERIIIGVNPEHWIVNDIKVGRHSQLADGGELPGAAFAEHAVGAEVRLDVLPTSANFSMLVTYVGPNPDGAAFCCTAIGHVALWTQADLTAEDGTLRIYLPLSSGVNIMPGSTAEICSYPQDPFRPQRILIAGSPDDWVVNDIKVGERSQFSQKGDVPGAAFAPTAQGAFVSFETVQTAMRFKLVVTYIGDKAEGAPLLACAIGAIPA